MPKPCVNCGDPTDGRSRCDFCRARHNLSVARCTTERRQRARAAGMCGDCLRAPAAPGRAACDPCLAATAHRLRSRSARQNTRLVLAV